MDIAGIPEAISRKAYTQLVEACGFDPEGLVSLDFRPDGIYAEMYATDDRGDRMIDRQASRAAVHRVYVRVVDDAE